MKTEANTRPDNRNIKQARLKYRQALDLFKRRLANLNKTDMLSYKKDKQATALRKEFLKMVKPFNRILSEGEEKAMELMKQVVDNFSRFHPHPEQIILSNPEEEPEFIKPYFGLKLFPVWHVGTDYLHEIGKNWYNFLVDNFVNFKWETKVTDIDFEKNLVYMGDEVILYDELIFGVGKSGIDFGKQLAEKYELPTEPKSVQIGVRFEAPQKHFQKLIDVAYDFKLYRKMDNVSLRSFCTNNNAAYVAVEETYGDHSYNGHAKKDEAYRNNMTNFGILMEIQGHLFNILMRELKL